VPGPAYLIDGPQYGNWSEVLFREIRAAGVDALHVTIAYHEDFRETVERIVDWNRRFEAHSDLILAGRVAADVERARASGRTAIFFGLQNPSPIEDDIGLVEILHALGVRFMQLTYNNQSLLAGGCYEAEDAGITRMGREAIREMNRVGMAIDMSHSAERSTLQAIELSSRPIAITHANPHAWHPVLRNKSATVLRALAESGGILGFSLYANHLKGGAACTREDFCAMVARTAELMGVAHLAIGSDLGQGQSDAVIRWMRDGRWNKSGAETPGLGKPVLPEQPAWFRGSRDFGNVREGLRAVGFGAEDVDAIMGMNWYRFFRDSFGPAEDRKSRAAR
jgi:microsomal dipeptidase-like Zn-dependent dipeptidase